MAQQENAPNKPVHLMYLCGAVILFYLLQWSIEWIWTFFGTPPTEFKITLMAAVGALVAGVVLYRNDRVYTLANEVAGELKKVTWPTMRETRAATVAVVIATFTAAVILGVFDYVWAKLSSLVY